MISSSGCGLSTSACASSICSAAAHVRPRLRADGDGARALHAWGVRELRQALRLPRYYMKIENALATRARRSDRSLSQLFCRCGECRLHSPTRLGCLHLSKKRIELVVECIELRLGGGRQRVEVLDGYQHGLGSVVLGDHDSAASNRHLQDAPELALRFARGH